MQAPTLSKQQLPGSEQIQPKQLQSKTKLFFKILLCFALLVFLASYFEVLTPLTNRRSAANLHTSLRMHLTSLLDRVATFRNSLVPLTSMPLTTATSSVTISVS